jgi:hypothetical protein
MGDVGRARTGAVFGERRTRSLARSVRACAVALPESPAITGSRATGVAARRPRKG